MPHRTIPPRLVPFLLAVAAASPAMAKPDAHTSAPVVTCPTAEDAGGGTEPPKNWEKLQDQRLLSSVVGVSECWSADVTNEKQAYLNDLYTSLVVTRVVTDPAMNEDGSQAFALGRDYKSERRNPFARLFVGRTTSLLVSAKVHIRDPDVDFTVPLLSIDYNGKSGQGESFVTNLTRSDMAQPFLRLTPNSSLSITVDARSSSDTDINAGGAVIATLRDALALAAPGSSLVSTVNSAQLNKIAGTFDAGLSRLWSNSVSESTTSGRLISEWYPTAAIFVSVDVPKNVRTYDDRQPKDGDGLGEKYRRRTLWFKIQLSCPRLSIFDTANICEFGDSAARPLTHSPFVEPHGNPGHAGTDYERFVRGLRGRLAPHQVLNYNLSAGKTIRQFITEQQWYATLTKSFSGTAKTDGSGQPSRMNEFCETVVEQLYNAGLSDLDSQISLWAFIEGLPDFVAFQQPFSKDQTCAAHVPDGWLADAKPRDAGAVAAATPARRKRRG